MFKYNLSIGKVIGKSFDRHGTEIPTSYSVFGMRGDRELAESAFVFQVSGFNTPQSQHWKVIWIQAGEEKELRGEFDSPELAVKALEEHLNGENA